MLSKSRKKIIKITVENKTYFISNILLSWETIRLTLDPNKARPIVKDVTIAEVLSIINAYYTIYFHDYSTANPTLFKFNRKELNIAPFDMVNDLKKELKQLENKNYFCENDLFLFKDGMKNKDHQKLKIITRKIQTFHIENTRCQNLRKIDSLRTMKGYTIKAVDQQNAIRSEKLKKLKNENN